MSKITDQNPLLPLLGEKRENFGDICGGGQSRLKKIKWILDIFQSEDIWRGRKFYIVKSCLFLSHSWLFINFPFRLNFKSTDNLLKIFPMMKRKVVEREYNFSPGLQNYLKIQISWFLCMSSLLQEIWYYAHSTEPQQSKYVSRSFKGCEFFRERTLELHLIFSKTWGF